MALLAEGDAMSEATKAQQRMASAIVDANTDSLRKPLTYAETLVLILEHSEAASPPPTKEEAEIAVDKMFDVWLQRRHSFYANKNLRVSGWREIAISLYHKVAASPQGTPDYASLLREIDDWCSGKKSVDDGEDAEDALRYIQDAIKAFLSAEVEALPDKCSDCDEAAKHAYSDATTPGFFSPKCKRHSTVAAQEKKP